MNGDWLQMMHEETPITAEVCNPAMVNSTKRFTIVCWFTQQPDNTCKCSKGCNGGGMPNWAGLCEHTHTFTEVTCVLSTRQSHIRAHIRSEPISHMTPFISKTHCSVRPDPRRWAGVKRKNDSFGGWYRKDFQVSVSQTSNSVLASLQKDHQTRCQSVLTVSSPHATELGSDRCNKALTSRKRLFSAKSWFQAFNIYPIISHIVQLSSWHTGVTLLTTPKELFCSAEAVRRKHSQTLLLLQVNVFEFLLKWSGINW